MVFKTILWEIDNNNYIKYNRKKNKSTMSLEIAFI